MRRIKYNKKYNRDVGERRAELLREIAHLRRITVAARER